MNNILVIQHIECEPLGTFGDILKAEGISYRYLKLYKDSYDTVDADQYKGLIILGGPMNVDELDKYPYLAWELDLIRNTQSKDLPILGICLGAQLIAKANGAEVKKSVAREVGWHKAYLIKEAASDSLFSGFGSEFNVFQLHSDMLEIPEGAVRLVYSEKCKNQAFRIKNNVYGLQFHLEVNKTMIKEWLKVYKDDLKSQDKANIAESLDVNLKELDKKARSFFGKFLEIYRHAVVRKILKSRQGRLFN